MEDKRMGLMSNSMAMPAGPHTMPDGSRMSGQQEAPELSDEQFDDALHRLTQAALQAMESPEVQQQLERAAAAQDQAQAIAETANSMLDALDEKSGESIPEDVLPAAALAIVGMIGEAIEADQKTVGKAADLMMRMAAEQSGMTPEQVEAEMAAASQQPEA